ncbi:hypothetical protein NUH88_06865 [Nisaea acidiphila]|uniref:Uncharacterized protein n=1 Tax=Nisaea acidiphila TaxID=1862145 RepID=A0A9J7AX94_9PROT|nr:hypothetical protein [Nisaea acidiphila]UUX51410.1 hypothetical protein NUH88_06865 [Nisaea acidiphila]
MVDRITGYTSGVVAPTTLRRSRPVAGEALNQRVTPRRNDKHPRDNDSEHDQGHHGDDSVDVRLSQDSLDLAGHASAAPSPYAAKAYGGAARHAAPRENDDVLISHSTAVLLTEDLSSLIRRAVTNVGLVVHGLMKVPDNAAHDVERRFHIAALAAVRPARELYLRKNGEQGQLPTGLAFENISARYDELRGAADITIGGAAFLDRIDFSATGVMFDVRGEAAVHEPKPGIFIDTGEHGAVIANRIIETVRRDLPHFGGSEDTEGAMVLIRADNSDFSDYRSPAEWLGFDLILPFRQA